MCDITCCDPCLRAKQTRLPFNDSLIKSTDCFDLRWGKENVSIRCSSTRSCGAEVTHARVHCDIWERYSTTSISRANCFLTPVDDYNRAVWVYLMKSKEEVKHFMFSFYNMVETQFGKRIKNIRANNGIEFQSKFMEYFYIEKGINFQTSCVYTPQQNGVVERKNRYLLEMAKALRFRGNLLLKFWENVF